MRFLIVFWAVYFVLFVLWVFSLSIKDRKRRYALQRYFAPLAFLGSLFLFVTIATDDPFLQNIGLPKEYEWIAGLLISGFALWTTYLNPLKERVIKTEIDVSSMKSSVESIKDDVGLIKEKLLEECSVRPRRRKK